jgi:hypothetical protein
MMDARKGNGAEPSGAEQTAAASAEKWLVLLVHGVGEQTPGGMIEAVTGAIRSIHPGLPDSEVFVVTHLKDDAASRGWFPMFTRRLRLRGGGEAVFGEVFWADLSRIRGGTYDFLVGVFRLIFGLRFVSDQAASHPGFWAALLRWLLYLTILIPRGPWLALLTLGSIYCLPGVVKWAARYTDVPDRWVAWVTDTGFYTAIGLGVAVAGLVLTIRELKGRRRLGAYGSCLVLAGLAVTTCCWNQALLEYINWLYDNELGPHPSPSHFLATNIWLSDWARDVAFILLGISLVALIPAVAWASSERRAGLVMAYAAAALQLLLWQLALAPLIVVLDMGLGAVGTPLGGEFVHEWTFYIASRLLIAYSLIFSALGILVLRARWARAHPAAAWPDWPPPRLIVGSATLVCLSLAALYLVIEYGFSAWSEIAHALGLTYPQAAKTFFEYVDRVVTPLMAPVWLVFVALAWFFWTSSNLARLILHVVTDVVNHFYRPAEKFPVRQQIERRFHVVFRKLVDQERPTRVIVIAHSQGTVIAFNSLASLASDPHLREAAGQLHIRVVTVGSPLTHLYQHYFPTEYQPLHDPRWTPLRELIDRWYNVFRTDDFVGTFVISDAADPRTQTWPENVPAEPGGHNNYWQPDIFRNFDDSIP